MENNELQEKFDNFIEAYIHLSTSDKRKEIIEKLRGMITNVMMINQELGRDYNLLINKELIDLNNDFLMEKDFLEGIFVYIHTLDDGINDLFDYLIKNNK